MTSQAYFKKTHRIGQIGVTIAIVLLLLVPTGVSLWYGIMPSPVDVVTSLVPLLTLFIPLAISEIFSYTPLLGTSTYLTFLTGNIMNLKLPAVINAIEMTGVEEGSEASDVISGIAVAVSSVVTMIIIILGVVLLVPLEPVLSSEPIQIASMYVTPSLFGALGLGILSGKASKDVTIKGKMKATWVSIALMTGLFFVLGSALIESLSGVLILVNLPIVYLISKYLYKRGQIQVLVGEET